MEGSEYEVELVEECNPQPEKHFSGYVLRCYDLFNFTTWELIWDANPQPDVIETEYIKQ